MEPSLNQNNYHGWARTIRLALISKKKYGFVDGTRTQPSLNEKMFESWEQCNTMIVTWMLNVMILSIAQSVM